MEASSLLGRDATDVESATGGKTPMKKPMLRTQARGRLRRVACLGSALIGLCVVALFVGSGDKHGNGLATLLTLEQEPEAKSPSLCYADIGGALFKYGMTAVPDGVCASYKFMGTLNHVAIPKSTCDIMKTMPSTYEDLACCTEDLCNSANLPGKELNVKSPSLCYVDMAGTLVKYTMIAVPDGVCASYAFMGRMTHIAISKGTCDLMKTMPAMYENLKCCTEDLCNKAADVESPGKKSDVDSLSKEDNATSLEKEPEVESPGKKSDAETLSFCYINGPMGTHMKQRVPDDVLDPVCVRFKSGVQGFVTYMYIDKKSCDVMKANPDGYEDLLCCATDLCNGDPASSKIVPSLSWPGQ